MVSQDRRHLFMTHCHQGCCWSEDGNTLAISLESYDVDTQRKKFGIFPGVQNVNKRRQKIRLTTANVEQFSQYIVITDSDTAKDTLFFTFRPLGMNEMGNEGESRRRII